MTTTPKPETDGATERPCPYSPQCACHEAELPCQFKAGNAFRMRVVNTHDTLKSETARLREQVKELREGLKPFARMASDIHEAAPDNALCVVATLNGGIMSNKEFCTVSDLRRARDLMEKTNA